jgi:hypothetical protein
MPTERTPKPTEIKTPLRGLGLMFWLTIGLGLTFVTAFLCGSCMLERFC